MKIKMQTMKHLYAVMIFCAIAFATVGCHSRKSKADEAATVQLNQETVALFADSIARSVVNGNPNVFNEALDKEGIKQLVSENSIVANGFEVEGGRDFFNKCLLVGNQAVAAVNNGGDFTVSKCYVKDKQYHIVFRTYDDFTVDFADYVVDTVKGKLKLKDAFLFSKGCMLSKDIESQMLFELMVLTNPDAEIHWLKDAVQLSQQKQFAQSLELLKAHKEALKSYPQFNQFYIANLSQISKRFIADLDAMKDEVDERTLLLHKLLYLVNMPSVQAGNASLAQMEETIDKLIGYCGDDPVFLFLYGVKKMDVDCTEALACFETVKKSMPYVWDLWMSELKCYSSLKDDAGLNDCLKKGTDLYGLSSAELADIKQHLQSAKK